MGGNTYVIRCFDEDWTVGNVVEFARNWMVYYDHSCDEKPDESCH